MKVNRLLNIFLLPSLALMAACTQEELRDDNAVATLFASIEQPAVTKTSLSGPTSWIYKTIWNDNDAIGVFVGDYEAAEFKLKDGSGTTRGMFQGVFGDQKGISMSKTAVYPYDIIKRKSGSAINVTLPQEQFYVEGNIAAGAYPMVAVTDGAEMNFKNLCSVLKISMTGSLTVKSIAFIPNNAEVKVSGDARINLDNNTLTMAEDAGTRVALVCDGVPLSGSVTEFHIVVPAQIYKGGFSLVIDTDKGRVLKTIRADITLKRSELYRITPFECKIDEDDKNVIFDDANFKAYMVANFDKNKDGEISFNEALKVTTIKVNTDNISSLAGIEHMTNLTSLTCTGSHNWNSIDRKYENEGRLKSLDISKNTRLLSLFCGFNQLSSIDVTNNPRLYILDCPGNNLINIDLSKNTALKQLTVSENLLTSIDLSNNTGLIYLDVSNNQLKIIDVRKNVLLNSLICSSNQLGSIDVSNNVDLQFIYCDSNHLTSINVFNNPNLQILYCLDNNLTSINVSKNVALQEVYCGMNRLSSIDVTHNPNLKVLHCEDNDISTINLKNNTELLSLVCDENNISELDLKKNIHLESLYFEYNNLSSIELNYCPNLKILDCANNKLSSLKINCCPKITYLNTFSNNLNVLDISTLTSLSWLNCYENPLKTLYIYEGQMNVITTKYIPTTTNIVVGSGPEEDEVFTVTPSSFDLDGKEQDITMTVTASMDYSLDSKPEWISQKSAESGTYVFTVAANETTSSRNGDIVFKNTGNAILTVTVKQGIQTYTSSDYSQDGKVTKLLSATVGNGIDVVFVGDAFADRDQELYNKYVELGTEAFFTEEPFKSTKNRFNIYRIGSVSKNGIITQEGGDTKFSSEFGQGTYIGGDNNLVNSFVKASIPSVDLTKTIIFVIINKAKYAGTCHMYSNNQAVCYVPLCENETEYAQTLRHEGCGHGFGKLADEYFYSSNGTIPESQITGLKQWRQFAYGFYENVDLTSDPNTVLWSRFISDSRYSGMVGVYEGGYTYPYGVYRPTENSIMRYNTGGFNAPSREAIYKKIMMFSEGDTWSYDYETFVEFDAPARSAAATMMATTQSATVDKVRFIPLAPPVMIIVDK